MQLSPLLRGLDDSTIEHGIFESIFGEESQAGATIGRIDSFLNPSLNFGSRMKRSKEFFLRCAVFVERNATTSREQAAKRRSDGG